MSLKLFNPEAEEGQTDRVLVYGDPGIGKSRFALSLPPRFGNILYYAADDNAQFLSSISRAKRKRVWVITPQGDDAIVNFQEFCDHDWKSLEGQTMADGRTFPQIGTIVVDTYSTVMERVLQEVANQGLSGAERHFYASAKDKGGQTIPNRGDYRGSDSISMGYLDTLFDLQRHYNIVFVCHGTLKYVDDVCIGGGPSHPGRRMLTELPARFSTVVRLVREDVEIQEPEYHVENAVVAITENDGRWVAKARLENEEDPNPLAHVVLNQTGSNFWGMYESIYHPIHEEAVNG